MNIAIIPARGGSKRIPRKNIKSFCGKPIIAYSIEAAKNSHAIDRVFVSTDDHEIADVARAHGAEVPFLRDASLSDDSTGTTPVVRQALSTLV
jgi:pseudaminic acid cytidylyltransferase